jgi:hypothetical protein
MNSSCHFFFYHLGMQIQFSNSNSPVSVLQGTKLYSTDLLNLFPLVSTIRFLATDLQHSHCEYIFQSHIKFSQTDLYYELPVAVFYRQLNSRLCWEPRYILGARKHITANTCHMIATHCCVTSPRALQSSGPWADTKKTLPPYC